MSLFCWEEKLLNSLERLLKFLGSFNIEHLLNILNSCQNCRYSGYCFVYYSLWSFIVVKGRKLLELYMHIQNLSGPVFFIIFASTTFKLLHFKWNMVGCNEHSIKFIQLTELLHVLQVTQTDKTRHKNQIIMKNKKRMKEENVMAKLVKGLLPFILW